MSISAASSAGISAAFQGCDMDERADSSRAVFRLRQRRRIGRFARSGRRLRRPAIKASSATLSPPAMSPAPLDWRIPWPATHSTTPPAWAASSPPTRDKSRIRSPRGRSAPPARCGFPPAASQAKNSGTINSSFATGAVTTGDNSNAGGFTAQNSPDSSTQSLPVAASPATVSTTAAAITNAQAFGQRHRRRIERRRRLRRDRREQQSRPVRRQL